MPELMRPTATLGRDAGWFIAIGLSGIILRLAFAWEYTSQPLGRYPWVDESSYWTWAQAIYRGEIWPIRPFYQDPLYPYVLACLMGVAGIDVANLRIASAALGGLTPLVVTGVGRIGLGRVEGLLAGCLTALYGPLIFADGSLEKEGLAAFWTAVALGSMAHLSRSDRLTAAGMAGISWGLVVLLRSNALVIAPLAIGWLFLGMSQQPGADPKRRIQLALAFLTGFLAVLTPVAAINTAVSKPPELMGTTWQLGPNFYIGNGPGATGTYMAPPFVRAHPAYEAADYAMEAMRRTRGPLTPGQVSRYWLRQGLRQWAEAPVDSLRAWFVKVGLVTHRFEIPDNQDIDFVRIMAAPVLGWGFVGFGIVFPLAVVGLARVPRTGFWWFASLATGLGLAATTLFFVVGRYRVPWVPGLALLAAAGVVDLVHRIRHRDWRGLGWRLGLLGLPAALWCWWPRPDPVPIRWGNQLIALALANLRAGQLESAIDALDLARVSSPELAEKVRQLTSDGPFHDLLAEAVSRELARVSIRATETRTAVRRARLLRQLGETSPEARSLLQTALRSSPGDQLLNREWGALLLSWPQQSPDRARAIEALDRASREPGADGRARLMLALITSNRTLLKGREASVEPDRDHFTMLVRAMLDSRH